MGPSKTCVVKYIRKGDAAINIVVSPETVVVEPPPTGSTRITKKVYVDLYVGPNRIDYSGNGGVNSEGFGCSTLKNTNDLGNGLKWGFNTDGDGRFYYIIYVYPTAVADMELPFTVNYKGNAYPRTLHIITSKKGEQGAVLRGPQAWSDCATGYAFKAGGSGEGFKDVVMYGSNYYSCVKSHAKTASNYPGSTEDTNNHYWQLGDKVELIATKILLSTYALVKNLGVECIDMKDSAGNILFRAKDGNVTCKTGTFEGITVRQATIESGKIAGFQISGNGLSNGPNFDNDAYVIFRNDYYKCFAGIGGNVLPATSGSRAVARFENDDTHDQWGLGRNIALLLSAENGTYNHAFLGNGNGTLNGMMAGFRFSKFQLTTANTIYDGYSNVKDNNYWIIYASQTGSGVTLPKLADVRKALSISDSTPFCLLFTISADLDSKDFYIYGRNKLKDSNDKTPWDTTQLPVMTHWNNGWDSRITLGPGDTETFLLIYDPTKYATKDGYSLYYTARRINHQS